MDDVYIYFLIDVIDLLSRLKIKYKNFFVILFIFN